MSFTFRILPLLALVCSPSAFGQGGLLGTRSVDGKIHFRAVDDLQIDGSRRIRLVPIATQQITADDARKLPRVDLQQVGIIRGDANHHLVRLDDSSKPSDLVLPDNFAAKGPMDPTLAQGRLPIEAFQSRKDKSGDMIPPEEFFVFIPGAEPDRLALTLLNRAPFFVSLDEQLAAMEAFPASFPDSPLKDEFRAELQDRLTDGLNAFDNRGAYDGLLLTRRFADLAGRAFPGDASLGQLSATVGNRVRMVESTRIRLQSLAAAEEWDALLDAYLPFERYQWSFPEMMELRQRAFAESARLHAHRASLLAERQLNGDALREFDVAARRDPDNKEIAKLRETTRVVASLADPAAKPRALAAGSPEDLRFRRSSHDADRAIQDKDFAKAESAIQEAQAENKEAPEILLLQARLLAGRGRNTAALPLLDQYDREVSDAAGRESGNATRNDILYDLDKKRTAFEQQLRQLQQQGDYTKLRALVTQALALDPDNDEFLYYSGAVAAVFRDPSAKEQLDRFLARSNSLRGNLDERDRAIRIGGLLDPPAPPQPRAGTPNWLSGRPLADEVYYCPVSGAFQLPIDSVAGYKLRMSFQWDGNRLSSISTAFDDDKGSQSYHALGGPADSQGNFFFAYGTGGQVQVASTHKLDGPPATGDLRVSHEMGMPPHLVDGHGLPRILLKDSPQFNPAVLTLLEGPLATGIAGNSFFNPFIWDGLHYFALSWDSRGRLATAREWSGDNLVRFTWSGDSLTDIRAFHKDSATPYYQRTISYSGGMITGESYAQGTKTGQIKYVYSGKVLQQIKVEDGGVHDGRTWTVHMR